MFYDRFLVNILVSGFLKSVASIFNLLQHNLHLHVQMFNKLRKFQRDVGTAQGAGD